MQAKEKEKQETILLKELIIRHQYVGYRGEISRDDDPRECYLKYLEPLNELKGRIGKLSFATSPVLQSSEGLQSALSVLEERLMPQTSGGETQVPSATL